MTLDRGARLVRDPDFAACPDGERRGRGAHGDVRELCALVLRVEDADRIVVLVDDPHAVDAGRRGPRRRCFPRSAGRLGRERDSAPSAGRRGRLRRAATNRARSASRSRCPACANWCVIVAGDENGGHRRAVVEVPLELEADAARHARLVGDVLPSRQAAARRRRRVEDVAAGPLAMVQAKPRRRC